MYCPVGGPPSAPPLLRPLCLTLDPAPLRRRGLQGAAKTEGGADGEAESNRRKIKRWDPAETNLLLSLVVEHGKGKWKRVLELGAGTFDKHRTTVDLKDKWRNLEKSGVAPKLPDNLETKRAPKKKKKGEEGAEGAEGASMQALAADAAMTTAAATDQLIQAVVSQPQLLAAVTANAGLAAAAAGAAAPATLSLSAADVAATMPIPTVTEPAAVPPAEAAAADTAKTRNTRSRAK